MASRNQRAGTVAEGLLILARLIAQRMIEDGDGEVASDPSPWKVREPARSRKPDEDRSSKT